MINFNVTDSLPRAEQFHTPLSGGFMSSIQRSPLLITPVEKILEQGETRHLAHVLVRHFNEMRWNQLVATLKYCELTQQNLCLHAHTYTFSFFLAAYQTSLKCSHYYSVSQCHAHADITPVSEPVSPPISLYCHCFLSSLTLLIFSIFI